MANNCKSFLAGVFIGGMVGAAVALLMAPKAGPEMRKDLEKGLEIAKGKGKKIYASVLNQAGQVGLNKEKLVEDNGNGRWMELPIHRETRKTKKEEPIILTGTTLALTNQETSEQQQHVQIEKVSSEEKKEKSES